METNRSANRIHPLMAAAAISVIIASLAGAAAITGILPSSHGANDAQSSAMPPAATAYNGSPAGTAEPLAASAQVSSQQPQVIKEVVVKEVVKAQPKPVHHHYSDVARNDGYSQQAPAPVAAPAPAPAPAAHPNYVAIGTGAVIGGLLGNQIGSGNGRKLATMAGVIGGGMVGNEMSKQSQQNQ
jgi:outer membrane lipoprotein SlyB